MPSSSSARKREGAAVHVLCGHTKPTKIENIDALWLRSVERCLEEFVRGTRCSYPLKLPTDLKTPEALMQTLRHSGVSLPTGKRSAKRVLYKRHLYRLYKTLRHESRQIYVDNMVASGQFATECEGVTIRAAKEIHKVHQSASSEVLRSFRTSPTRMKRGKKIISLLS